MHQHAGQTQTLTHPLALGEDSLYVFAFRNLLSLTSPRAQLSYLYPLHLSLLTLSVLDLVGCVLFIFHSSYSAQQLCSLYILFFGVIFICLTAYQCSLFLSSYSLHILPYCLVEFKLKVCCGFLCRVSTVLGIRIWFYCHTLAVFSCCLSLPVVFVCQPWR